MICMDEFPKKVSVLGIYADECLALDMMAGLDGC